ncbi:MULTISPECIES: hypothetical protein [Streptomyces]|uniref:Secreted protein n=1 Tax=Streptomyces venezuelae TaxID=54571 RepID=A0A5P2BNQ0_STRVZ|nr:MULTISPECIES: hypothetical protein [Streptomyces]MYY81153.1 hypothetical protein [Streptomyces sp. SID335]MYZ13785.1 hypothetical protein [Streptomyces sp. SID337]NDZ86813.1 hypothetical protein [Streptomyces sp. SID10115]NEB49055.1 hypothetical protein [Streptomyces sp. SID339]QES30731.1 hypothetical protein DEJ47_33770 [Streptomyces venezuelae]
MNSSVSKGSAWAILALGAALTSTALGPTASAAAPRDAGGGTATVTTARQQACPVVYFDLGETLVHTADDGSITYRPGAAAYLRALRARGIPVGLITNVPSSWGSTDAERAARLRQEVDSTWEGSAPFAWQDFGDRVLTPRTEAERKPAPALWQRAKAGSGHCRVVYQAETTEEVSVAASLGFVPYQVGRPHRPAFLPVGVVELLGRRAPA